MKRTLLPLALFVALLAGSGPDAVGARTSKVSDLVDQLAVTESAPGALEELVAIGPAVIDSLANEANDDGAEMSSRGWAIVGLQRIGGKRASTELDTILADDSNPPLVRTWAASARMGTSKDFDELMALQPHIYTWPALERPFGMQAVALADTGDIGQMLSISAQVPEVNEAFAPIIAKAGSKELIVAMRTAPDDNARRMAAGYVASLSQSDNAVAGQILDAYDFEPGAEAVPWDGGALWIPSVGWKKKDARELIGSLIQWHFYCGEKGWSGPQQQVTNNLYSVGLTRPAGFSGSMYGNSEELLAEYGRVVGTKEANELRQELKR